MGKPADIDTYVESLAAEVQPLAQKVRDLIREAAPRSDETIRYGMPAFNLGGGRFLYFGVWRRHVGLYPIYRGSEAFEADVAPYRSGKDAVKFALEKPLPEGLITRIVRVQATLRKP